MNYVSGHAALNDQKLRKMMRNILAKSEHSDITLLRSVLYCDYLIICSEFSIQVYKLEQMKVQFFQAL